MQRRGRDGDGTVKKRGEGRSLEAKRKALGSQKNFQSGLAPEKSALSHPGTFTGSFCHREPRLHVTGPPRPFLSGFYFCWNATGLVLRRTCSSESSHWVIALAILLEAFSRCGPSRTYYSFATQSHVPETNFQLRRPDKYLN